MRIFVCEFITAGGMRGDILNSGLFQEGYLMSESLLRDLSEIPNFQIFTTHDSRLKQSSYVSESIPIYSGDNVWKIWEDCIVNSDAVWPVAPETHGILLQLTELIEKNGKILIGSGADTIRITSSKYATYNYLKDSGFNSNPTYKYLDNPYIYDEEGWVGKLDDGAGCEDSRYFQSYAELKRWLSEGREFTHVFQRFLHGQPASVSIMCNHGSFHLLSCNLQKVSLADNYFKYQGSIVNGLSEHWDNFECFVKKIVELFPGLAGYVGIDLMVKNKEYHYLEINPRITTSYVGLNQALGMNPAKLILEFMFPELFYNKVFKMPELPRLIENVIIDE